MAKKKPAKKSLKKSPKQQKKEEVKTKTDIPIEVKADIPDEIPMDVPKEPLLEIPYHDKKPVLFKGIAVHLFVYVIIAITLAFLNVPSMYIFLTMMILVWGLFVISYAYYKKK